MKIAHKLSVLAFRLHLFLSSEEGQDLVEYALVVALIAFGATASMKALAGASTMRSAIPAVRFRRISHSFRKREAEWRQNRSPLIGLPLGSEVGILFRNLNLGS